MSGLDNSFMCPLAFQAFKENSKSLTVSASPRPRSPFPDWTSSCLPPCSLGLRHTGLLFNPVTNHLLLRVLVLVAPITWSFLTWIFSRQLLPYLQISAPLLSLQIDFPWTLKSSSIPNNHHHLSYDLISFNLFIWKYLTHFSYILAYCFSPRGTWLTRISCNQKNV